MVQPSFQMPFAATLALIAAYQHGLAWRANADTSLGARVGLWGGREVFGLALASFVAGLLPPRLTPPTTSTALRLTVCSPICSRCRSFPPR